MASPSLARAEDGIPAIEAAAFAERFLGDSPRVAAIELEVAARHADVTAASRLPNPALTYEREEVFAGDTGVAESTLTIGWTLDPSGRRARRVAAAREDVRAAGARAGQARLRALVEALGVFYDAAYARLRLRALDEGRAPLARMVEALRARVREGDAAGYDLTRLEIELAAYDERIAEATAELRAARRVLAAALGDEAGVIDAADELALPAVPADLSELVDRALTRRGDYLATGHDRTSAAAALSAARREWIPRLGVELGVKRAEIELGAATGYFASIEVELPLFSRGRADAERARVAARTAEVQRAQLRRDIVAEVGAPYERLAAAVEQASVFRTAQLERARVLVTQAEAAYQAGEGSPVELLDAYRTALDARLRDLALRRRARAASLSLALAVGQPPELP